MIPFDNTTLGNQVKMILITAICAMFLLSPNFAYAHAYSASFTEINFTDDKTEMAFSIDTLSIIELVEDVDGNKNGILEEPEMNEESHHIEELVEEFLVLDKNNEEQIPEIEEVKLDRKDNKEFITFHITYPAFFPGDTITLNDGFYFNDSATNYINLISAKNRGESSEAVLQGDNRSWTILLSEVQQEQQVPGGEETGTENSQEPDQQPKSETTTKSNSSSWFSFFKLGTFHILTGYDHLLFLLALLLRKQTFKQYAAIVTSFTIAHSVTLSLAVLGLVDLPSRFVEATIAFSICYVAAENIFKKEINHRWSLTFLFGLIHGLGFANILQEMNISKSHLAASLLSFNVGIEVVQLSIVILLLPLLAYIHKLSISKKILQYGSAIIILLGGFWFVERIFL